ncbi:hypothetical protein [Rubrivivax rivuli]|uniref:Uncharacterized protein n=1 Tax=Rubrivivax rivuli TaxID=1862385 RepID=A0A437R7T5_9BURK|nr:hypothetical protein [Rubrivivax rivuli]RVU42848.1 hypothetical protein EOE66_21470 [Rubrivivax rivuli]
MALVIAVLFIWRFRSAIDDFLKRVVEGNIFGQAFKAIPPAQQSTATSATEDRLATAADNAVRPAEPQARQDPAAVPPELAQDPSAPAALRYIQENPGQTLLEYRRVLFAYHSERLFTRIYGTQITMLEYLKSNADVPTKLSALTQFHDEHQQRASSTEYQLRDYLGFLVSFGVVSQSGPSDSHEYKITENGIQFLSYIKANYPTNWNQRAY